MADKNMAKFLKNRHILVATFFQGQTRCCVFSVLNGLRNEIV